ncbi:fluoride efflux transporter CrcB [Aquabacter sediminis]|uniref:fluoride efflux transporter CrcB n=1 Tax=Aquabacter sediminis TaxID=3029197 RepID=UPI00237E6C76|nr:fluoride efflux transporter CrcB [Aquabacter sp. P-9]MDE1570257.1 fluoride efflux transporter CrcB [Aquabacter sp. P-9]
MQAAVIVFLGAGLGGVLRHMMNLLGLRLFGLGGFPFTTMIVNVTGCFIMGLATGWFASRYGEGWPQGVRLLLTTGMLGGYTTFSTFSLEFAVLVERGDLGHAVLYAGGSLVLTLIAVFAGLFVMRAIA